MTSANDGIDRTTWNGSERRNQLSLVELRFRLPASMQDNPANITPAGHCALLLMDVLRDNALAPQTSKRWQDIYHNVYLGLANRFLAYSQEGDLSNAVAFIDWLGDVTSIEAWSLAMKDLIQGGQLPETMTKESLTEFVFFRAKTRST